MINVLIIIISPRFLIANGAIMHPALLTARIFFCSKQITLHTIKGQILPTNGFNHLVSIKHGNAVTFWTTCPSQLSPGRKQNLLNCEVLIYRRYWSLWAYKIFTHGTYIKSGTSISRRISYQEPLNRPFGTGIEADVPMIRFLSFLKFYFLDCVF